MPSRTQAIVLAAGRSSRFNTSATKLSFTICGQEMIRYPLNLLKSLEIKTHVVVGYQQETVRAILAKHSYTTECVEQTIQKGTGHALLCTQAYWTEDTLLVLNGDTPLLTQEQIKNLLEQHRAASAAISLIVGRTHDPSVTGYGRVIQEGKHVAIVEHRDFTGDLQRSYLLNAGVYAIDRSFLEEAIPQLKVHSHGEMYITDLVEIASGQQKTVSLVEVPFEYARGINTLKELHAAERFIRLECINALMAKGVRFIDPESVIIDSDVTIGPNTIIGFGVHLRQGTQIGENVTIDSFSILDNAVVGNSVTVHSHSVISHASIHHSAKVGPFARIHQQSILHSESVVGNFVEVSKTSLGSKSKAKHLTYLGQSQIGKQANIGAGTITCNYNGVTKHTTTIEDGAFIGSNSALLAPVTIGSEAIVAAGSVITESVPAQALAIARQRQTTKLEYASLIKSKHGQPAASSKLKIKLATQGS